MGCWSESCAVTGMEIRYDNRVYVAMVNSEGYNSQQIIVIPPVLGIYDYGGIELLENNTEFGLVKGDAWQPREIEGSDPIYIDAVILEDVLPTISKEFPYAYNETNEPISIDTIADACAIKRTLSP